MIYRGPGFLAIVWFDSSPTPSPSSSGSKLDRQHTGTEKERQVMYWRERGEGGGWGAKPYDRKKAWSSINNSILSDFMHLNKNNQRQHFFTLFAPGERLERLTKNAKVSTVLGSIPASSNTAKSKGQPTLTPPPPPGCHCHIGHLPFRDR